MNSERRREKQLQEMYISSKRTFTGTLTLLVKEKPHSCCQIQRQTEGEAVTR